jgi:hypothetical protein
MQSPTPHSHNYKAFLLRCWVESAKEGALWRFSLEPVGDGRRLGFTDLEDLVNFLKEDINWQGSEVFHKE